MGVHVIDPTGGVWRAEKNYKYALLSVPEDGGTRRIRLRAEGKDALRRGLRYVSSIRKPELVTSGNRAWLKGSEDVAITVDSDGKYRGVIWGFRENGDSYVAKAFGELDVPTAIVSAVSAAAAAERVLAMNISRELMTMGLDETVGAYSVLAWGDDRKRLEDEAIAYDGPTRVVATERSKK